MELRTGYGGLVLGFGQFYVMTKPPRKYYLVKVVKRDAKYNFITFYYIPDTFCGTLQTQFLAAPYICEGEFLVAILSSE